MKSSVYLSAYPAMEGCDLSSELPGDLSPDRGRGVECGRAMHCAYTLDVLDCYLVDLESPMCTSRPARIPRSSFRLLYETLELHFEQGAT